ncbi:phosphatase [Haloarchaeobius sp. DFWS5]|uniref:phosphatase n=1 Tax=Haloarchaeobius sp. DFWS5 TaxID=3446114 RepID=UPI003EBABC3C
MSEQETLHVRPFGYVEPYPVVCEVDDASVFIGNVHATTARSFDAVLSLTEKRQPETTHYHPLVDGPETDWPEFAAAVDETRAFLAEAGSLLVHCKAGVSRSAAVLATALAVEQEEPFLAGLDRVQAARPVAVPHPALHELGVVYLAARS